MTLRLLRNDETTARNNDTAGARTERDGNRRGGSRRSGSGLMVGWLPASGTGCRPTGATSLGFEEDASSATVQRGESTSRQRRNSPGRPSGADVRPRPFSCDGGARKPSRLLQRRSLRDPLHPQVDRFRDRGLGNPRRSRGREVRGGRRGRGGRCAAGRVCRSVWRRNANSRPAAGTSRSPDSDGHTGGSRDRQGSSGFARRATLRDLPDMSEDDPIPAMPQDPAPQQDPAPLQIPEPQQLPEPAPGQPSPDSQPLDKMRDCGDENQNCREALDKWQRDALAKISLDITPSFNPDERDPDRVINEEADRDRTLAKAPSAPGAIARAACWAPAVSRHPAWGFAMILDNNNQIITFRFDELCDDDLCFIALWWGVPTECTLGDEPYLARYWQPTTMTWKASGLCHKPLYFEEMQLERYGHMTGPLLEPVVSGAALLSRNLATLPDQAGINPPGSANMLLATTGRAIASWLAAPFL